MRDAVEVARATTNSGELVLRRRGTVLELRVNGVYVMDTAETGSEIELARTALASVDRPGRVLVGGLGLGFTTKEVLADARVERLVVVELEAALIQWLRDGTVPHGPAYLDDDRLEVVNANLRHAVADAGAATFDLVLMDVDNGPDNLVVADNACLYAETFLRELRSIVRVGGAVAIWSAAPTPALEARLADVFGHCAAISHDVVLGSRDETYWLYLSRRS